MLRFTLGAVSALAVSLSIAGWIFLRSALSFSLPEPTPIDIWLPANAEIHGARDVYVGTYGAFFITLPLQEFRARFPDGGLVVYPNWPGDHEEEDITTWKAGDGSILYRTTQKIHRPQHWPPAASIRVLTHHEGTIVAIPTNTLRGHGASLCILAGLCWVATVLVFVGLMKTGKPPAATAPSPSSVATPAQ